MRMVDWSKIDLEEVKEKQAKRRREIEEEEEKKRVDEEWRRIEKIRVEETRVRKEKKRREEEESNRREKMLCMQNIWVYYYKTSVWTDFGQGQGQNIYRQQYYYQSTMKKGHVTWKSHEMISQAQSGLEELIGLEGSTRLEEPR